MKPLSYKERRRLYRPVESALGKIALAWNELHHALSYLFIKFTKLDSVQGLAIWNCLLIDRAQRELLRAAAENCKDLDPSKLKDVLWLCDQVNKLSNDRNDALHAPFVILYNHRTNGPPSLTPRWFFGNPRAKSLIGNLDGALENPDVTKKLILCRLKAEVLNEYASDMSFSGERRPWPERPVLPTLGQTRTRKAKSRRKSAKALPPRPRPSRD